MLRRLKREVPGKWVFMTERGNQLGTRNVRHIVERCAQHAGIEHVVSPHALRHGCGFALANAGVPRRDIQHWLGHVSIRHTQIYTQLAADRMEKVSIWND